jgi:hypothetical protein
VEQIELSNQTSENSNSNHEQINNESDKETHNIVYPVRPNKDLRLGERAALRSTINQVSKLQRNPHNKGYKK